MNANGGDIFVSDPLLMAFGSGFKAYCETASLPPKVLKKLLDSSSTWRQQIVAYFSQYGPKTSGLLIPRTRVKGNVGPGQAILFVQLGENCSIQSGTFTCEGPLKRIVKVFWARRKFNFPVVRGIKDTLLRRKVNKKLTVAANAPKVTQNPLFGHDMNHRMCINFSASDGRRAAFAALDEGFDVDDENVDPEWINQIMEESLRLRGY